MTRIFGILVVVVLLIVLVVWYSGRAKSRAVSSGDVFVHNGSDTSKPAPAPMPEDHPVDHQGTDQASVQPETQTQPAAGSTDGTGAIVPPATDSIARNPPNGMIFAGTGKYQLYRQGDLTWRLNTDTGQACIIFATDAQWQLAKVYRNGCGRS